MNDEGDVDGDNDGMQWPLAIMLIMILSVLMKFKTFIYWIMGCHFLFPI